MNDDDIVIDQTDEDMLLDEAGTADEMLAKIKELKNELQGVKKEKQEYLDGWQRAKADYVNALKRFEEEKKNAIQLGKAVSAGAFLPVMDSLERAEGAGEVLGSFTAIAKQLHDAAKLLGLKKIGELGEKFNPVLHEALGQDTVTKEAQDDTVTQILESGWRSNESVIRPAKVRVGNFTV